MTATSREQFIAALHQLADLLTSTPELPAPRYPRLLVPLPRSHHPTNVALLRGYAEIADAEFRSDEHGAHATITLNGLTYDIYACSPKAIAEHDALMSYSTSVQP